MKSYRSLRTVSLFFKVLAYVGLVVGLLLDTAFLMSQTDGNILALLMGVGQIILVLLVFVILLACSEFIMLGINVADHVASIADHVYVLAQNSESPKKDVSDDEL